MLNRMIAIVLGATILLSGCKKQDDAESSEVASYNRPATDKFLHETTFLTAHNAFVNTHDGGWMAGVAANQGLTGVDDQLKAGVRSFMIDLHMQGDTAMICHNSCEDKLLKIIAAKQSVKTFFEKIVKFLNDHHDEIAVVQLEDYVDADHLKREIKDIGDLEKLIFDPYKNDVQGKGWPRLRDMISSNHRLLILSSRDDKKGMGIGFDQEFTTENYWSMGENIFKSDRSCHTRWDNIPLDKKEPHFQRLFVMNHFRDMPMIAMSLMDNRSSDIKSRIKDNCQKPAGRYPNFIALDYANRGGGLDVVNWLNAGAK